MVSIPAQYRPPVFSMSISDVVVEVVLHNRVWWKKRRMLYHVNGAYAVVHPQGTMSMTTSSRDDHLDVQDHDDYDHDDYENDYHSSNYCNWFRVYDGYVYHRSSMCDSYYYQYWDDPTTSSLPSMLTLAWME